MLRLLLRGVCLLMLIATFAASLMALTWAFLPPPPTHRSTGLTIEQIRLMQQLVTTKVVVTDVVTTRVAGHTGAMEVVIALRGELTIGVDLSTAELIEVDDAARHAVLSLPVLTLLDARVDHGRSRVAAIRSDGLWKVIPADPVIDARMIDAAYSQAQRRLEEATIPEDSRQRAKHQAETVIGILAARLGWTIELKWKH
jgi:hypothetical protein